MRSFGGDLHVELRAAFHGDQAGLINDAVGGDERQNVVFRLLRGQRLLEIDRQTDFAAFGFGQEHVPAARLVASVSDCLSADSLEICLQGVAENSFTTTPSNPRIESAVGVFSGNSSERFCVRASSML